MATFDVNQIVQDLQEARIQWRDGQKRPREPLGREFPSREAVTLVMDNLKGVLFPMRLGAQHLHFESENFYVGYLLDSALQGLLAQARLELSATARVRGLHEINVDSLAEGAVREFGHSLPNIRRLLDSDVLAAYQGDPAALSVDEILLCYPGVLAMIYHRSAHRLHQLGLPLLARIVAELAHAQTGIDIHPGARIGSSFFIDHGTGVVIGETAVIGRNVRIYQAVTLGAKRFPISEDGTLQKGLSRHPVVEDDVVIYAGATILGRVTLGKGAIIGGNVWITDDVPPGTSVTQANTQRSSDSHTHAA